MSSRELNLQLINQNSFRLTEKGTVEDTCPSLLSFALTQNQTWRNAAYWLAPNGLLCLLFHTTQDQWWCCPSGLSPPTSIISEYRKPNRDIFSIESLSSKMTPLPMSS